MQKSPSTSPPIASVCGASRDANGVLTPDLDPEMQDFDRERRRALRTFLMRRRSRLDPVDVGLPRTGRRRVPGLRRPEVAELIQVTVDWYRRFECGRPVRVSPQFVARLINALRLNGYEGLTLYCLAIPEIYIAARPFSMSRARGVEGRAA